MYTYIVAAMLVAYYGYVAFKEKGGLPQHVKDIKEYYRELRWTDLILTLIFVLGVVITTVMVVFTFVFSLPDVAQRVVENDKTAHAAVAHVASLGKLETLVDIFNGVLILGIAHYIGQMFARYYQDRPWINVICYVGIFGIMSVFNANFIAPMLTFSSISIAALGMYLTIHAFYNRENDQQIATRLASDTLGRIFTILTLFLTLSALLGDIKILLH